MTLKAAYDTNNNNIVTGFYDTDVHSTIPTPNITISTADWETALSQQESGNTVKVNDAETALEYIDNTPTLSEAKTNKIAALESEMHSQISRNITVSAKSYRCDPFNIALIYSINSEYADLTNKDGSGDINWWHGDDTVSKVDDVDLQAVREAYAIRAANSIDHADSLRTQINNAVDQTALDAIDITAGWPS